MSATSQNTSGFKTFTATAVALAQNVRVKVDSSGTVSVAGATDDWIGVTEHPCAASGNVTVRLRNSTGTFNFTAAGAVTVGNKLYPAASGKVDDAQSNGHYTGFIAITAATADGDIIEAVPSNGATRIGTLTVPLTLSSIADGDVLSNYPLTFAGAIIAIDYFQGVPVTTGAKATTLNLEINTTNLTGGTVALTSATCTPLGKTIPSAAITGANTFASGDTLSVEASSTTAFVEGTGYLVITYISY